MNLSEVFTYPFQNEFLLRKQKSLRRELLQRENIPYVEKKIAILGGSTVDDVKNILELFLLSEGIKPQFWQSEYNKFFEDAVFGNAELDAFQPEIIIVFTGFVNLINLPTVGDDAETVQKKLAAEFDRFRQVWDGLSRYNAVIIQNNFELPYTNALGSLDAAEIFGVSRFVERLNEKFADAATANKIFYLHDIHGLAARIGLATWHNRAQFYAYKFAVNYDFIPEVSWSLKKIICAILGKTKKCLVLDLDNTLWGGVISEDGIGGISIGAETAAGEAYSEFQKYVKALKNRGIILAVCSKNDDDVARSGFTHPDSILTADDFISFHANWEPKNINIQQIAQEINIGLDSLVFIDDNPAERAIVRENLPEVAVPEVDSADVFSYIRAIEDNGYFDAVKISADDFKRNQTYRENIFRANLAETAKSYDEFLASLEMQAEVAPFQEIYFDRIAQLTNKTNQFNLTTLRCTLADIKRMAANKNFVTVYIRLKDKFGDNGIISLAIGEKRGAELHILLWLMSCRVLKRTVENLMLDTLVAGAKKIGCESLIGYYFPTQKNKMVAELYQDFGFEKIGEVWKLKISDYQNKNKFIEVAK